MKVGTKPGIALTDSKVSAMCCHLLEKDGERRKGGNVTTATAFEDRIMLLRDLIKESISHSCNGDTLTEEIILTQVGSIKMPDQNVWKKTDSKKDHDCQGYDKMHLSGLAMK